MKNTMKLLSLRFIALASAISLPGCGDDDVISPVTLPATPAEPTPDAGAPLVDASPAASTDAGAPSAVADASLALPADAGTAPTVPLGSLSVGERPESAQFDPVTNAWYVSVQAKADVPGDGYIAKLDPSASAIVSERFVTGLNEPKGIRVHEGKLFVADVSELVTIDLATAQVVSKTTVIDIDPDAPVSPFLNDVAVRASTGFVYVSDNRNDALYRFDDAGAAPVLLLRDARLEAPNGLLVDERDLDDPRLLIAAQGPGFDPALGVTEKLGAVLSIGIADLNDGDGQTVVSFVSQRIGNLDGIELSGNDLLVTDILGGRLLRVTPSATTPPAFGEGDAQVLRSGLARGADLGLDPARGLVVIPETTSGLVTAITLE